MGTNDKSDQMPICRVCDEPSPRNVTVWSSADPDMLAVRMLTVARSVGQNKWRPSAAVVHNQHLHGHRPHVHSGHLHGRQTPVHGLLICRAASNAPEDRSWGELAAEAARVARLDFVLAQPNACPRRDLLCAIWRFVSCCALSRYADTLQRCFEQGPQSRGGHPASPQQLTAGRQSPSRSLRRVAGWSLPARGCEHSIFALTRFCTAPPWRLPQAC